MRWDGHSKAATVEDCHTLDLVALLRRRLFRPGWDAPLSSLRWTNVSTGKETASLGYSLEWEDESAALTLRYGVTRNGERTEVEEPVRLVGTPQPFGGLRWWFLCPACNRRVLKLHLPPGGNLFGCRTCYRLTYESVQKHNARVDRFRKDPDAARQAVEAYLHNLKSSRLGRFPASAFKAAFARERN